MNSLESDNIKAWNVTISKSALIKMIARCVGDNWPARDGDFDIEIVAHNSSGNKIFEVDRIEILIKKKGVKVPGNGSMFDLIIIDAALDDGGIE